MKSRKRNKSESHDIHLQNAGCFTGIPSRYFFQKWVRTALKGQVTSTQVTIRIVDEQEGAELNQHYRHKRGPTNVLSFPFDTLPDAREPSIYLGDIVICAPVILKEARAQKKTLEAHWAHMVIHGVLHLLGYDHIKANEAERMENCEIAILARLGFPNPYYLNEANNGR
jgi:probable rRNA maturation factor